MNAKSPRIPPPTSSSFEQDGGLFTREIILTVVLALFTVLALYVCARMIAPFLAPIVFAATIVVASQRPYTALAGILPTPSIRSAVAVILVSALVLVPLSLLITYALSHGIETFRGAGEEQSAGLQERVRSLPFVTTISQFLPADLNVREQVKSAAAAIADNAARILGSSIQIAIQIVITIFLLFFFYRDGDKAYERLGRLLPLTENESERLLTRVRDSMLATVNGALTVALVQSILAGSVYVLLGVPGAIMWGAATFFMALLPVFGTFTIWGPIAVYLALSGAAMKAALLVGFGICAIGGIDNLLYPYLVGDRMRMHTVTAFFAILGGIALFGAAGLILGPLIFTLTSELLDVWWRRTRQGRSAETNAVREPEAPTDTAPSSLLESEGN